MDRHRRAGAPCPSAASWAFRGPSCRLRRWLIVLALLLASAPVPGLTRLSTAAPTSRWEDPNCPGIRPGATMLTEKDQKYKTSWNFLFTGSDGGTYSLMDAYGLVAKPTANVVVRPQPVRTERTFARGKGPGVADGSTRVVGHAVWYAQDSPDEWALIRLDRGQRWASTVCGYGRPRSIDSTIDNLPTQVAFYGQAGERQTRAGTDILAYGRYAPGTVTKTGPVTSGDWSAPVLSGDNQAFGFLGHSGCCSGRDYTRPLGPGGWVYRLQPLLQRSGERLGLTFSLPRSLSGVAT